MEDLSNLAPCGIFSFSDDGHIAEANATLLAYLGFSAEELHGKKLESILSLASRIFYQTHFFPLLKLQGRVDEIFLTFLSKDRTEISVLVNGVRKKQGDAYRIYCACMPLHERKKYEDEILRAKKAAEEALHKNEELIRIRKELELNLEELDRHREKVERINDDLMQVNFLVSHELMEPVRKISMFSGDLRRDDKNILSAQSVLSLEKVQAACTRMRQLISSLELFFSMSTSDHSLHTVDLNKVLEDSLTRLQKPEDCHFHIESDTLPDIEGYEDQLGHLFFQLLSNALQFRSPDRELHIRVHSTLVQENTFTALRHKYRYTDFVKIIFSDNGAGFESRYADYVFKIFKKLDAEGMGLGFGLALCRKVALNHYGSISARSHPGKGTDIIILLPLKQPQAQTGLVP